MADCEIKTVTSEDATENNSGEKIKATKTSNKGECLEDLLTTLSHQINNSDWLQLNTADKFAAENPEIARAFRDAASKDSQASDGPATRDSV